ncbi:MAG: hypothetical protein ACOCS7_00130 [Halolamina sp.]
MADNKKGRDKKAHDEEGRQREREIATELERGEQPEPPIDPSELGVLEEELEPLEFPVTGAELIAAVGNHEIEATDEAHTIEELVPDTDAETFESPAAVRVRVQRPTVAAAMKRVLEASETVSDADLGGSQRDAYEKTFRELEAIDADDDDEGIQVISDWIIERIHETKTLPGSRAVRRQAATFCRANGYRVRNDEWLGI